MFSCFWTLLITKKCWKHEKQQYSLKKWLAQNILAFLLFLDTFYYKTRPKTVRWCARLNRSPIWMIESITMYCILKYFLEVTISYLHRFREIFHLDYDIWYLSFRVYEILNQNQNISWLQISWDITHEPQYLMVTDFVRY